MSRGYVDFSVGIESATGGGYRVRAFSPNAEAESLAQLDFDLDGLRESLSSRRSSALPDPWLRDLAWGAEAPPASLDLMDAGRTLFAALFTGEVGELYSAAWSAALDAGHGLRIRLHLRPRNPELAWLTKVPWEILFDDRAGCFPCLNPQNPLIRHLDLPRPVERAPFALPLRVLIVAANPAGLSALDLKGEQEAMGASGQVQIKVLEDPGPEDLRRELQSGKHQIVHFMGHGLSDSARGSLVFSTPEGRPLLVTGSQLSHLVQGTPALGLALLNACHSASTPKGSGADPLAGVAGALVRGGLSAVVGMQLAISDRAALAFSKVLYAKLAEGDPIEAAVSEARLALYLSDPDVSDWVAPVLFLRGHDHRIEEKEVGEKPSERDVNHVVWESEELNSDHAEFVGKKISGDLQGGSERPSENRVNVKVGTADVKRLIITGSVQRKSR
jgi:hypothetical protein